MWGRFFIIIRNHVITCHLWLMLPNLRPSPNLYKYRVRILSKTKSLFSIFHDLKNHVWNRKQQRERVTLCVPLYDYISMWTNTDCTLTH